MVVLCWYSLVNTAHFFLLQIPDLPRGVKNFVSEPVPRLQTLLTAIELSHQFFFFASSTSENRHCSLLIPPPSRESASPRNRLKKDCTIDKQPFRFLQPASERHVGRQSRTIAAFDRRHSLYLISPRTYTQGLEFIVACLQLDHKFPLVNWPIFHFTRLTQKMRM